MSTPKVIGLTGPKRAGKDTVAAALRNYLGEADVVRLAFADPLKAELAKACDVSLEFIEEHKADFRLGLQFWGTEFRRNLFGKDYWINRTRDYFNHVTGEGWGFPPKLVVFTDTRFPNEVDFIRSISGKIWRVERSDVIDNDPHPSERALDDHEPDRVIKSKSGNVAGLHAQAIAAYQEDFPCTKN